MKIKKIILLLLSLATIILELLPVGAVLYFLNPDGEPWRRTYSYFSLTPYGYGNFGPFFTAILSCVLVILAGIFLWKSAKKLSVTIAVLSGVAFFTSLLPILYGISYLTAIGLAISVLLLAEMILAIRITQKLS